MNKNVGYIKAEDIINIKDNIQKGAELTLLNIQPIKDNNDALNVLKHYSKMPKLANKWFLKNEEYLKKYPEDADKGLDDFIFNDNSITFINDVLILPVDEDGGILLSNYRAIYRVDYFEPEKSGSAPLIVNMIVKDIYNRAKELNPKK